MQRGDFLSRRLSVVFAVLLIACCGASAWLQIRSNGRHEQEVIQRLSIGLAANIASNSALMAQGSLNPQAVHDLFDKLMVANPSVEVYLLGLDGRIEGQAAPPGRLKSEKVDVAPIRRLLAGAPLPVLGDDPRGDGAGKVFSAAPLRVDGRDVGYVYVVLQGEDYDALAAHAAADNVLRTTLWSIALVTLLGLLAEHVGVLHSLLAVLVMLVVAFFLTPAVRRPRYLESAGTGPSRDSVEW